VSPDGEAIVTGAGDETLRFWNVFSKTRCTKVKYSVFVNQLATQLGLPPLSQLVNQADFLASVVWDFFSEFLNAF